MNAKELVKKLAQSQVMRSEVPMQMQLGLPYLEKRSERLCISFRPHREAPADGNIEVYAQQYEIAWVYPFEHLASFRNLTLDGPVDVSQPICTVPGKTMLSVGKYMLEKLYEECSRVLTFQEKDGAVSDTMLEQYRGKYRETARALGLEALYCPETAEE